MIKFKKIIFPITLLTIITAVGIIIAVNAIYIALTNNNAAIYAAVIIPIILVLIFLYILERLLIPKVPYIKLMLGELIIGLLVFFMFLYQNSTTDIKFDTNQEYILVVFDSKVDSFSKLNKKRIFGEELNVHNTNIVHLDSSMALRKDLRINKPKEWTSFIEYRSEFYKNGDSIKYILISKKDLGPGYRMHSQTYIDSLLNEEK
jgi:hypothetical protein